MASRAEKRLWRAVWLTAGLAVVAACGRDEEVRVETIELAKGEYSGLSWGGTQVDRFHVVARKGTSNRAEDEVVLVSPQHAEPCSLGPLARYITQQPRSGAKFVLGSPSPARIAVFDDVDEHGVGRLSFADIDCERTGPPLPDILAFPLYEVHSPDLMKLYFGALTRERNLLVVDAWDERVLSTGATNVRGVLTTATGVWLLEDTELVKRDLRGRELARKGEDVHEMPVLLGPDGDMAYVDGGRVILERLGNVRQLASDACSSGLRALDGFLPGSLAFYAPCEDRRLVIARNMSDALVFDGPVATYTAQRGQLIIVRASETATTLWTVSSNDPANLRKWVDLPPMEVQDIWPVAGHWLLRARMPDRTGTIFRIQDRVPAEPAEVVAEDLSRIDLHPRGVAWLTTSGDLTVTDRNALGVYVRASGVAAFTFMFDRKATAIAYLEDVDEQTQLGDLRLTFLEGEAYALARDVREFREVWWPERGVLYARGGEDPGLRFGRIDLPCEVTSESPWACGF